MGALIFILALLMPLAAIAGGSGALRVVIEKNPAQVAVLAKNSSKLAEAIREADDFELARLADAVMEG